jgi:tetratricopeptide (TPR) repeat protein
MATGGNGAPSAGAAAPSMLAAYRRRALLTQEELADRSGLSVRTIRELEAGRVRRPRRESLRLLADALHLADQERAALTTADGAVPDRQRAVPATPVCQLPMDVAGFTGRSDGLARLDGLLAAAGDGQATAVVISAIAGTAGVGKTALAVHWAHQVRERFPDGQLFVNLHGYAPGPATSPLQALAQLLRGLGVEADQIPVELEQAAGLYRSLLASRRMLIVLDNARDAEQVRPLLPGGPACLVVVVTSRDRLAGLVTSHGAQRTLNTLGGIHQRLGRYRQAADHHQRALDLARESNARYPATEALLGLAAAHRHRGQHAKAVQRAEQASTAARRGGYRGLEGQAHAALSAAHLDAGDLDQAAAHGRQALEVQRQTGHRLGQAHTLVTLGQVLLRTSGADAAAPCWREARWLFSDIGCPEQPPREERHRDDRRGDAVPDRGSRGRPARPS